MSLSPLSYREVKRKLEAAGFTEISQKGSHVKFFKRTHEGTRTAIVPHHREISVGTLRSILRQAGISPDEFEALRDIVSRLGVADVKAFGLTWEDCEQFLRRLGYSVRVEVIAQR